MPPSPRPSPASADRSGRLGAARTAPSTTPARPTAWDSMLPTSGAQDKTASQPIIGTPDGEDRAVERPRLGRPPVAPEAGQPEPFVPEPALPKAGPEIRGLPRLGPELRRHGPRSPSCICEGSRAPYAWFRHRTWQIPPGQPVMSAEIVGRCHHCVVCTSPTVSDDGDLGRGYRLETWPTWPRPLALLVLDSSPMLWQSFTAG